MKTKIRKIALRKLSGLFLLMKKYFNSSQKCDKLKIAKGEFSIAKEKDKENNWCKAKTC